MNFPKSVHSVKTSNGLERDTFWSQPLPVDVFARTDVIHFLCSHAFLEVG